MTLTKADGAHDDGAHDDGQIKLDFRAPAHDCSYLPAETASLQYHLIPKMSAERYYEYLRRGWRRHGVYFFRPQCTACRQCQSLRVCADTFRPSKSQRRCLKRNEDVECSIHRPSVTDEQLALFNRYHAAMHQKKGWPLRQTTETEYVESFLLGQFEFSYEFRYHRAGQLVGVGLVDMTPWAMSSVYFYHAPEWRPDAPGVFSMLFELVVAQHHRIPRHYLGYWISACPSMAYKSNYGPHEILQRYVEFDEEPEWKPSQAK